MTGRQEVSPSAPPRASRAGREAQKRRTRAAIVQATAHLISTSDQIPSVDQIAAAADVSRRTVYLSFPNLDQLLLDAAAGALSTAVVEAALDHVGGSDAVAAVDALVRAFLATAPVTLPLGRKIIALTIDSPAPVEVEPRRSFRRVAWIENTLEPARDQLKP